MTSNPVRLDSGERLAWSGKPEPLAYAIRMGRGTFLFGIPFFAFSVFWISTAASATPKGGHPFGFPFWLFGIPFVLVGAGMLLSPLWHYLRGVRASYVLTNRRAVVDIAGPFAQRISVPLDQIRFVELRPAGTGAGDVLFREVVSSGKSGTVRRDGFMAIAEADRVEQLLRAAIDKATPARAPAP